MIKKIAACFAAILAAVALPAPEARAYKRVCLYMPSGAVFVAEYFNVQVEGGGRSIRSIGDIPVWQHKCADITPLGAVGKRIQISVRASKYAPASRDEICTPEWIYVGKGDADLTVFARSTGQYEFICYVPGF